MEGYILGSRNIAEVEFKQKFKKLYGVRELTKFDQLFRNNFIQKKDFKNISSLGANAIRLPFNYRLIEVKPFSYSEQGFAYLDKALTWAEEYDLGIILDLHAACGAQNCDWHSDSNGEALLWEETKYQERTYALWESIADRFKDRSSLIGYDILNEPVLVKKSVNILKRFYQQIIKRIKKVDKVHLIFLEGNVWAQDIDFLKDLIDDNVCVSIHSYMPLDYVFNFSPYLRFPSKIGDVLCNKKTIYNYLEPYFRFSIENKVKIFVGEFGINWRGGFWGEIKYLESILSIFEKFNFGYTYWTYKSVANGIFPDGMYQYIPNSKYIKRGELISGWENYLTLWKKEKFKLGDFWQTRNFTPNTKVIAVLRKFFKK